LYTSKPFVCAATADYIGTYPMRMLTPKLYIIVNCGIIYMHLKGCHRDFKGKYLLVELWKEPLTYKDVLH
jgi:hypothetical protein